MKDAIWSHKTPEDLIREGILISRDAARAAWGEEGEQHYWDQMKQARPELMRPNQDNFRTRKININPTVVTHISETARRNMRFFSASHYRTGR